MAAMEGDDQVIQGAFGVQGVRGPCGWRGEVVVREGLGVAGIELGCLIEVAWR